MITGEKLSVSVKKVGIEEKKYDSGAILEEEEYNSRRNLWVFRVQGFGYSSVTGSTDKD
jgi:hypothetical protein